MIIRKFKTAKEVKAICSNIRSNVNKKRQFDETDIICVNGIKASTGFEVTKHDIIYYCSEKQSTKSIYPPYTIRISQQIQN